MGSLSDTYENKILDAILGAGLTRPSTVYTALFIVSPSDSTFGTEVTGGSYGRVALTNNATNWPNAVSSSKRNGTLITFPTATASWGTVVAWALLDHATASAAANVIFWGALSGPRVVNIGDTPTFPVNALSITSD